MSDRQEQIFLEYEKRRHRRRLLMLAWFAFVVAAGYALAQAEAVRSTFALVLVVCVITGVGLGWISWRNWRCPSCERGLDRGEPRHCQHCGVRLRA